MSTQKFTGAVRTRADATQWLLTLQRLMVARMMQVLLQSVSALDLRLTCVSKLYAEAE